MPHFTKGIMATQTALLSMCAARQDHGLAPTMVMSVWKAIARPLYEIGSEIWATEIPPV
jgi:hypothetical protein